MILCWHRYEYCTDHFKKGYGQFVCSKCGKIKKNKPTWRQRHCRHEWYRSLYTEYKILHCSICGYFRIPEWDPNEEED